MRIKYLLLFGFLFFVSGQSFAQEAPLEVTVAQDESVDETDIPYEDFSEHESEEPVYTDEELVPENKVTLQSALSESVTLNPLLSLETTGSIFDQFSAFEKNKMLMNLQTEEEKMQLERDRVHLQRLKL
ncbi:MAG: hypothetical protein JXR30_00805, partial [Alphaproteobacteria bacterium]|nr:hypothetical protein [Alphaproteobacteria bacterium]